MQLIKEKHEFGTNVFYGDEQKYIGFTFGGNGDLYWVIHSAAEKDFTVTKENYALYELFEQLYNDIENVNIFPDDQELFYESEESKARYRLYNRSNYNELFDEEQKIITWYSDETARIVANYVRITKGTNSYTLSFFVQSHINGYDRDFHSSSYIPVRFRNSGSSYDPFNIVFMRMYLSLVNIDDINDYGHQIHFEEYLYEQEKARKLIKE